MYALNSSIALNAMMFNPSPENPNLFVAQSRPVHFRWDGETFNGTIWGATRPFQLRLQPVEEVRQGFVLDRNRSDIEVLPVLAARLPQWVAAYCLQGSAAVLVPFEAFTDPPPLEEPANPNVSQAELQEAQAAVQVDHHLVFIDFTPRPAPFPHSNLPIISTVGINRRIATA